MPADRRAQLAQSRGTLVWTEQDVETHSAGTPFTASTSLINRERRWNSWPAWNDNPNPFRLRNRHRVDSPIPID